MADSDKDETIPDVAIDTKVEPKVEPTIDTKREKRLAQLADARESNKTKKRNRDEDLTEIKAGVSELLQRKKSKSERTAAAVVEPTKVEPPVVVTRQASEEPNVVAEEKWEPTWTQSAIRSGALIVLAGASYWFQNFYGKRKPSAPVKSKVNARPAAASAASNTVPIFAAPANRKSVGNSGFYV